MEKQCVKCKSLKPILDFYIVKGRLHSWCKRCVIAYQMVWYEKHREERITYSKRYSAIYNRGEKAKEYQKKYRKEHKKEIREYQRKYYKRKRAFERNRRSHGITNDCPICALRAAQRGQQFTALDGEAQAPQIIQTSIAPIISSPAEGDASLHNNFDSHITKEA